MTDAQMTTHRLTPYIDLIESFLDGRIDALTFEQKYLDMFKRDETEWKNEAYEILNDLFGDVDAFCADPALRGPEDLDEGQLRQHAKVAVERLLGIEHSSRSSLQSGR